MKLNCRFCKPLTKIKTIAFNCEWYLVAEGFPYNLLSAYLKILTIYYNIYYRPIGSRAQPLNMKVIKINKTIATLSYRT